MRKRSLALKLTTFTVLTLCFSILFGGSLLLGNLKNILSSWGQDLQMNIYLNSGHTEEQRNSIKEKVLQYPGVDEVSYLSEEESLKVFRSQMAEYALDLLKDPELVQMIPASLAVKFKTEGPEQIQTMNQIKNDFAKNEAIEEVSFGQDWVKKYTHITEFFSGFAWILGISIAAATLFVISNVIQSSIRQRRTEIEVLELLGATANMIRRPFLFEGIKIGFAAMLSAVVFNGFLYQLLIDKFSGTLALLRLTHTIHFLDLKMIIAFLVVGPLLGLMASYLCLMKINTGWSAAKRS